MTAQRVYLFKKKKEIQTDLTALGFSDVVGLSFDPLQVHFPTLRKISGSVRLCLELSDKVGTCSKLLHNLFLVHMDKAAQKCF